MDVQALFSVPADVRGVPSAPGLSDTLYGIEVEIEGVSPSTGSHVDSKYWRVTTDGSLRDGLELVLVQPLGGSDLVRALRELSSIVCTMEEQVGGPLLLSHRCSLHLHIDFRSRTIEQLISFCTGYTLFEAGLYTVAGKERYSSIYCPGLTNATSQLDALGSLHAAAKTDRSSAVYDIVSSFVKYTSINLRRLCDLGSVEIRTHEGTCDPDEIMLWVQLYDKLARCMRYKPEDLLVAAEKDIQGLASDIFQEHTELIMCPEYAQYYHNNLLNAKHIVYYDALTARRKYKQKPAKPEPAAGTEDLAAVAQAIVNYINSRS